MSRGIGFAFLREMNTEKTLLPTLARVGLSAKGFTYCLLGTLLVLSALHLQSSKNATSTGVFNQVLDLPAGSVLLILLIFGLLCYTGWRFIQTFGSSRKKVPARARYFFSGLSYAALAFSAYTILKGGGGGGGNQNQQWAGEILSKPLGQWLLGIGALIMVVTGFYQIWYGLSEKYKKHVQEIHPEKQSSRVLLRSGKIGYIARGLVWLLIGYLVLKAALNSNPGEAGGSEKAFRLVESASLGSIFLLLIALGLVCYGIFCFLRARYENFAASMA